MVVLGLDIGGANLKAATTDQRAAAVPFALWKQPDRLPFALAELVAQFPDVGEFAVTMTGELCDCFPTKRDGVNAILNAVQAVSGDRPVQVWNTSSGFVTVAEARSEFLAVAASNWHALATYAGRFTPQGAALLLDIGTTTTDVIPLQDGRPIARGRTDTERMIHRELLYTGVRRTPVCALMPPGTVAAEFFASTLDVYLKLGLIPDDEQDHDTADGRPATRSHAHARLSRMLGGDPELTPESESMRLATQVMQTQQRLLRDALGPPRRLILSGSGEFLAKSLISAEWEVISLQSRLGPIVSTCAPAYALAVLAEEKR